MQQVFSNISVVGEPRRWQNLTVVGLRVSAGTELSYALASVSFQRNKLRIHETGSVSEVEFCSTSSRYTLVPEGERLIGGRQDRVVNASVLIPPMGKSRVSVSCVEQNRWEPRPGVDPGQFSIATELAAPSQRTVLKSTTGNSHSADQQSVWQSVGESVSSLGAGNNRGSLTQAFDAVRSSAHDALRALCYVDGANGIAIAVGRKLRTMEIFNQVRKLEQCWKRIVASHLVETLGEGANETAELDELTGVICSLEKAQWRNVDSALSGEESRTDFGTGRGSVLSLGDSVIHASVVFAK